MRLIPLLFTVLFMCFYALLVQPIFSAEAETVAAVATAPVDYAFLVWQWANSPVVVMISTSLIALFLGKLFTWKPEWKIVYDQFRGNLMAAVKFAEKTIPNGTENAGLRRMDTACLYAIQLDAAINKAGSPDAIKQALSIVHAEAEAAGNI